MSKKEQQEAKELEKNLKEQEAQVVEDIKTEESSVENDENIEEISIEDQLKEQIEQEKNKFLRLFADFENYKKRTAKEKLELFSSANAKLMSEFLPILDDFTRGLSEIEKNADEHVVQGVTLIYDKFHKTLVREGLVQIEAKAGDVFNADVHEALTQIPSPSEDMKGKIIDVISEGYKIGEKIIRYPKVVVGQ